MNNNTTHFIPSNNDMPNCAKTLNSGSVVLKCIGAIIGIIVIIMGFMAMAKVGFIYGLLSVVIGVAIIAIFVFTAAMYEALAEITINVRKSAQSEQQQLYYIQKMCETQVNSQKNTDNAVNSVNQ